MARYIDADALLARLPDDLPYKASVKRVLTQADTADVVPRADTINEFADRLIRYYDSLNGGTASGLVAYHVNKIRQEMLNKEENT